MGRLKKINYEKRQTSIKGSKMCSKNHKVAIARFQNTWYNVIGAKEKEAPPKEVFPFPAPLTSKLLGSRRGSAKARACE